MKYGLVAIIVFVSALSACSLRDSAPNVKLDANNIRDAVPANEPFSRYGNPESYEVMGKTYQVLTTNLGFVQKGDASWYGTKFHGKKTSSGEDYNMYAMTAAHKTLPLPTYVEVKNLENG
ncbi:MAG: septal ring lytic transglycosylase RlpA family lipoprotein, partial [Gammaproteobacteria bacterium]|nr:septal ring lytic transglycosylase RlpA family lipoprotein [Gammaproteobacteria bacterium]